MGSYFAKIGISIGGYKLQSKAPKLPKFDVFGANFNKKHPISAKFGAFFKEIGILMGGKVEPK